MDLRTAQWLVSTDAAHALGLAREAVDGPDALTAASGLRQRVPGLDPSYGAAALEQATVSRIASERYGVQAPVFLTRDGLEQATRPEVAAWRAASFVAAGVRRVVDLTAGIGFDTNAFVTAGLEVVAVERDPVTATLLSANAPRARVVVGDALDVLPDLLADLSPADVVFVDPARRDPGGPRDQVTGRARPERDPARWSPPWSWVQSIPHPRVVAKVSAAFEPPTGWQSRCTSWDRTVVEAQVASWPLDAADRSALVLSRGAALVVAAGAELAYLPPAAPWPGWLHEPDPAVVRGGASGRLAGELGLVGLDPDSSWLGGDGPVASPALRSFRVVTQLPGSRRERRRTLAALHVERVVVKSRDARVDPAQVRRDLGVGEGGDHVVVITRRGGRTVSVLTTVRP